MIGKKIIYPILRKIIHFISGRISVFYPFLFKILFELVYINKTSVHYAYLKHYYKPNYEKAVISWLLLGVLLFFSWQIKKGKLKVITRIFMYMSIIPTLSVFWLKDENTKAFLLIILYWTIWYASVYFINGNLYHENISQKNEYMPRNKNLFFNLLFMFALVTVVYFSCRYGNMRLFANFGDVDLYRHENPMSSLGGYIFSWNTNVILPLLLIVHLKKKRWILTGIDVLLFLLSYSIYVNKSIFFTMLMTIAIGIVFICEVEYMLDRLLGCFLVLYQTACLVVPIDITNWLVALNQRLLASPAEGHFYYFDFFSNREFLYLRESILARFFQSPYRERTAILIGSDSKYGMGIWNYFNNGLFSMAYGNFGVVGVILHPIIIVFTYLLLVRLMKGFDAGIQYTLILSSVIYILSTTYTSWWLTGGLLVELIILGCLKGYIKK